MYDRLTPLGAQHDRRDARPERRRHAATSSRRSCSSRRRSVADHGRDDHRGGPGTTDRADPPRRLRRPAHLLRHGRRRDLRRRLRHAADRSLLLDQARDNGIAGAIDIPGAPAIQLVLGLYDYQPTAKVRRRRSPRQQEQGAAQSAGADGPAGAARHRHLPRRHQPVVRARTGPSARPFDRTRHLRASTRSRRSSSARAAATRSRTRCSSTRRATGSASKAGARVYEDLRQRNDPGDVDAPRRARRPHQTNVPVQAARRASCGWRRARFRSSGVTLPGADCVGGGRRGPAAHRRRPTSCSSTGRAPRPARRSWSAARRSVTTTPA